MNKTTLTTAMDLLYRKYLIPMILLDQEGTPLYPPLTLTAKNPLKHYFSIITANICLVVLHFS